MDPRGQSLGAKENTVEAVLQKVTNQEYRTEYVSYFVTIITIVTWWYVLLQIYSKYKCSLFF